jgi:hypothetical protein
MVLIGIISLMLFQVEVWGFAPNSSIIQNSADNFDITNNLRVSWRLDEINGGWRLRSLACLGENNRYYKVILKKDK